MIDEITGRQIPGQHPQDTSLKVDGPVAAYFKIFDQILSHAYEIPKLEIPYNRLFIASVPAMLVLCRTGEETYRVYLSANTMLKSILRPYFDCDQKDEDVRKIVEKLRIEWEASKGAFDSCGLLRIGAETQAGGDTFSCISINAGYSMVSMKDSISSKYIDSETQFKQMTDWKINVPVNNIETGIRMAENNAYAKVNCQYHHIYSTFVELATMLEIIGIDDSIILDRRLVQTNEGAKDDYAKIAKNHEGVR